MPQILKKERSFRFELIRNGIMEEHFNLIYPPDSYSIKEAPRHGIMKVFSEKSNNNIYIDDFGDDNKIIRLKGTTGDPTERRGYKDGFFVAYSGQEAIKEFREKIINWRTKKKIQGRNLQDYYVRFTNYYDEEEYYVFITNFELEKSAGKPLFYVYSIEMITIKTPEPEARFKPLKFLDDAKRTLSTINGLYANAIEDLNNLIRYNVITDTLKDVTDIAIETLTLANRVTETIGEVGATTVDVITNNLSDINTIVDGLDYIINTWEEAIDEDDYFGMFDGFHDSIRRMKREWERLVNAKKEYVFKNEPAEIKENITIEEYIDRGYDDVENKSSVEIDESSGKTLSEIVKIVREKYGVDIREIDVADYNKMTTSVVPEGVKIRIPLDTGAYYNEDNQVVTNDKLNDNLGRDLKRLDGRLLGSSGGDLVAIGKFDNMLQAIDNVLNTEFNAIVKLPEYGFSVKHSVGQPNADLFLKTLKIRYISSIKRDPRVVDVVDVKIVVDGDKVSISGHILIEGVNVEHKFTL